MNETPEGAEKTPQTRVSSNIIRTVTGDTFNALVLEGTEPIVVEFMSYGCAHCRAIEPVLQQVAEKLKSKEEIFRVNTAVDQELTDSYQIQGTPTFIMFLSGKEIGRVEGPHPTVSSVLTALTQPFGS
jgi:thioredoxin 1